MRRLLNQIREPNPIDPPEAQACANGCQGRPLKPLKHPAMAHKWFAWLARMVAKLRRGNPARGALAPLGGQGSAVGAELGCRTQALLERNLFLFLAMVPENNNGARKYFRSLAI